MIYQTAEDGLGDTVKPRLIEAGADLDRVLVIDLSVCSFSGSDGKVAAYLVQLYCCTIDAVYLRLRHLYRLSPDLESVFDSAGC